MIGVWTEKMRFSSYRRVFRHFYLVIVSLNNSGQLKQILSVSSFSAIIKVGFTNLKTFPLWWIMYNEEYNHLSLCLSLPSFFPSLSIHPRFIFLLFPHLLCELRFFLLLFSKPILILIPLYFFFPPFPFPSSYSHPASQGRSLSSNPNHP